MWRRSARGACDGGHAARRNDVDGGLVRHDALRVAIGAVDGGRGVPRFVAPAPPRLTRCGKLSSPALLHFRCKGPQHHDYDAVLRRMPGDGAAL